MKKIIKILFPESIKKCLRWCENIFFRIRYGFTDPVILQDIYDINFVLYPKDTTPIRWLIERSAYQKEFSVINTLVTPGDVTFDIGANTGIITSYLNTRVGPSGTVHCFEPFPDTYRKLKVNLALNPSDMVTSNQIAISDSIGTHKFYFEPTNAELNSLGMVSNGTEKLSKTIDVQTQTIDAYCEQHAITKIHFMKIDTEGYEIEVLKGAQKMLTQKNIDFIQFEISTQPLHSLGKNADEIIRYLKDRTYDVYEYSPHTGTFQRIETINSSFDNFYASCNDLTKYNK